MIEAHVAEPITDLESFLEENLKKELLRFTTAGSVDDGKSTLIGRLLHDSKSVYEDQLASVRKSRINRAAGPIDFSLLTDGLRAEREQGITIDVAYRYFSTADRKFIIADTPGHEQYTRNMATGASTADLAVILIDATKGLLPQTHRHAYIAALLGIPNVIGAVNKMDLVGYEEGVFAKLEGEFTRLANQLGIRFVQCIPISALEGDNVVTRSSQTLWYSGPTLLRHLETVPIQREQESEELRFPVQSVIRPDRTFRGFAGRVASGRIRPGDEIIALPSKQRTKVQTIVSYDGDLEEALTGQSVVLQLEKEIDLSRGDMIAGTDGVPHISRRFSAMVVWLHEVALRPNLTYLVKHAGRQVKARAIRIRYGVDVNSLREHAAEQLEMNGIASVEFESSLPLYFDPYSKNRTTGNFILIDPLSNATVGAAMIREDLTENGVAAATENAVSSHERTGKVTSEERSERRGHRAGILSVVGDAGLAERLERNLFERGFEAVLINADEIPATVFAHVVSSSWEAGLVAIVASEAFTPEQRDVLKRVAGELLFEIAPGDQAETIEDFLKQKVTSADRLRTAGGVTDERRAG